VEDDPNDIEFTQWKLRHLGCQIVSVETLPQFEAELERRPDLILSDMNVTRLDGFSALAIATKKCPDVPFVLLSGTLHEETRVVALARGAAACLLKDDPDPDSLERVIRRLCGKDRTQS
jgi:CheY-like chemotaxis protein